ncbi:protein FAM166B-like [Pomacea canaliculata]|uniref:protein FAM166B-like n=1 Tax=Pomacea canaliculata TaxID=400727 RepID=UPI000D73D351|nr:protein FAM166B-like [Pomacea canaliculata]
MTTIEFGGGPTIEQRRMFAGLQDETQVPGYRGYIPQMKYRIGKTYGNDTNEIFKEFGLKRAATVIGYVPTKTTGKPLPKSNGDNIYTDQMVPGYTGYIPRLTFKYGNTYKRKCDDCIQEFKTNLENYEAKQDELRRQTTSCPRLTAISYDPLVRDHLNLFRDTHPLRPILMEDKRPLLEPPMPGYRGFIPRISPTELSLGQRYHTGTGKCLKAFAKEQARHDAYYKGTLTDTSSVTVERQPYSGAGDPEYDRRLYPKGGMLPKYTGYLPQRKFVFGNTYGDTTRSLEVCSHNLPSYADFVKTKPPHLPTVLC